MSVRSVNWVAAMAAVLVLGTGCIVNVSSRAQPYDRCSSGEVCGGGTTCQSANLAVTGMTAGAHCTTSCAASGTCPIDPSGANGICVITSGNSQCFRSCARGPADCDPGFTCATPTGTSEAVCVPNGTGGTPPPCGGVGQACCADGTCSGGAVCNGTTCVAPPGPYEGCAPLGATCGGGTVCAAPRIANPGTTGFCTLDCSGSAAECPASPIAGRSFNCYVLTAGQPGQCFIDCAGADISCPTGTVCSMTTSATGAQIRLCMPCPNGMCG